MTLTQTETNGESPPRHTLRVNLRRNLADQIFRLILGFLTSGSILNKNGTPLPSAVIFLRVFSDGSIPLYKMHGRIDWTLRQMFSNVSLFIFPSSSVNLSHSTVAAVLHFVYTSHSSRNSIPGNARNGCPANC